MRFWYGYTGEGFVLGNGRNLRRRVPDSPALQKILDIAEEQHTRQRLQGIAKKTFMAAMVAPLAMQELGAASPPATNFSSAGQLLGVLEGLPIEQAAINLFNGRTAGAYAEEDQAALARRIANAFSDGDLLLLPRDAARLHTLQIMNTLPGAVVFLLSRSQAERKAFSDYLRRGTPPGLSADGKLIPAKSRPVLRTWEREARLLHMSDAL